jgi:raffinose/stachyose/melibiose transport system permease protein
LYSLPVYVAVLNVVKETENIRRDPAGFPSPLTFDNLVAVLTRPDGLIFVGFTTSLVTVTATLALLVTLGSMAGYALSRAEGRASRVVLVLMLMGIMLPTQVTLIPVTRVLRFFSLMNTMPGLVLFNVGFYMPFTVFLFTGFMRAIPRELDEAAEIDGASRLETFWRIVFPLLRPAVATVIVFVGLAIWNDFLNPAIILGPAQGTTITTGLYRALGRYSTDYGQMFAMMFVASVPIVLLFLRLQRFFVSGLTAGATKG